MKKRKKAVIIVLILIALLLISALWLIFTNRFVKTTVYEIYDQNLPEGFEGYKIAHISDLHNYEYGQGNCELIDILTEEAPDVIFITGDIVDRMNKNIDISANFAKKAVAVAPCYYVTGNHDYSLKQSFPVLESVLENAGVELLRDEYTFLYSGEDSIQLIGVDDPLFLQRETKGKYNSGQAMSIQLEGIERTGKYTVLLSHRPELFDVYAGYGINLVFSGHAHGGQVRLPLIGGLYAPHQGAFPQYDGGEYSSGETRMIVSKGLGNSVFPIRINNPPEAVFAVLHRNRSCLY